MIIPVNPDGTYGIECALCEKQLTDPIFVVPNFIRDSSNRLSRYAHWPMHWDCFASWKYQRRLSKEYFEAVRQHAPNDPSRIVVADSAMFLVLVFPASRGPITEVHLQASPGLRVLASEWTNFIRGGWDSICEHDVQRLAMFDVEDAMRQAIPDSETLLTLVKDKLKP